MASAEKTVWVLSDIHYASAAEKAKGYCADRAIPNPAARLLAQCFHHFVWQRDYFAHNHWLDLFTQQPGEPDWVVALGDYSVGTSSVGVSDDASLASARECLGILRGRFGARFRPVFGDHELGKTNLFGGPGGPRLASWRRACHDLEIPPFWSVDLGVYRLIAVVSTLVAFPLYEPDALPEERAEWADHRRVHLEQIRQAFATLGPSQRVLLFCHDPTALPFLWREPAVQARLGQIEQTLIGHLHTSLVLWKSRLLAGMPRIHFLGPGVRRVSAALHEARLWRPFHVRLCPVLAGIELWRQSGYYEARLAPGGAPPARFLWRRLRV